MDLTEKEKGEGQMDVRNLDGRKQKELSDGKRKKDGWALQPKKKKKKKRNHGRDQETVETTDPQNRERERETDPTELWGAIRK